METRETLVNLNTASEQELTQLPRIGVDKARKIVHYRGVRKGFRDWADFAETPGIAPEDIEALRGRAWIGPVVEEPEKTPAPRRTGRRPASLRRPHR
jgi:DNA uptake protein ComE-like DNA-binding protein